jgi:hypothetical protein|tara:strand:- start:1490 stop:1834 length:345 start_codon:yes stop_codon:yes gene_type:complete
MILKFLGFFFSVLTAYSLIKTQSAFSKKTGILFTLFISKISWFSLIITCYYGLKTFSLLWFAVGLLIPVALVETTYRYIKKYLIEKIKDPIMMQRIKTIFEYLVIFIIIKYVFF